MPNPVCPGDPSIVPGTLWSVGWQQLFFPAANSTTGRNGFLVPDGPLEILDSGTCLPDKPLNLRLTPNPISSILPSLSPTSNDDVVHPGKMSLSGLLPVFSQNQSGSAYSVMASHTENPDGVSELQRQTNPAPTRGLYIRDNWATRTTFRTTPPRTCETSSPSGWRKSKRICKPCPVPSRRLSHIDIMQASGIVRLYSHYTPKVTNPIRNPNLSGFSSLSNRPIRLQVAESKKVI